MEVRYGLKGKDRKALVQAISEITETPAKYLGAPSMAYQIGRYQITKDGNLTGTDLDGIIEDLKERGFIPEGTEDAAEPAEETAEPTEETTEPSEDSAVLLSGILFPFLCRFLEVHRGNLRLVLRVRHLPELHHILDGSDEEGEGSHALEPCRQCAHQLPIHIDGAAAHALQYANRVIHQIPRGICHNQGCRRLSIVQDAHDIHMKGTDLTALIHHGVAGSRHALLNLANGHDGRHG